MVTTHNAVIGLIRRVMLVSEMPAAMRFTAFAVVLVIIMTSSAITQSPSLLTMVLGSELLGS